MPEDYEGPEGEEQEEGGEPEVSPEAQAAWDRRLRRLGLVKDEEPAAEEEEAEEEPAAAPARRTQETPREPAAPPRPKFMKAARGFEDRQARRTYVAEMEKQNAILEKLASMVPEKGTSAPDPSDPDAYTKHLVAEAVKDALGVETIEYLRGQRTEADTRSQETAEQEQRREALQAWGGDMTNWEEEYAEANPEVAAGYPERLAGYMARATQRYIDMGDHPKTAYENAVFDLVGLSQAALKRGYNPAQFADVYFQEGAARAGGAPTKKTGQKKANREIAERRTAATKAGGTIGTVRAPASPTPAGRIASAKPGSASALANAARRSGGDPRQALREFRDSQDE